MNHHPTDAPFLLIPLVVPALLRQGEGPPGLEDGVEALEDRVLRQGDLSD